MYRRSSLRHLTRLNPLESLARSSRFDVRKFNSTKLGHFHSTRDLRTIGAQIVAFIWDDELLIYTASYLIQRSLQ